MRKPKRELRNRNNKPNGAAQNSNGFPSAAELRAAEVAASTLDADTLAGYLNTVRANCYAFSFRISIAEGVGDAARVKQLKETPEYVSLQKRRAYLEKQMANQFPEYKSADFDKLIVERAIVADDYLGSLRLKRDSAFASQAARELGEEAEAKIALQEHTRALKYIKVLEPKYNALLRALEKK